MQNKGTLGRRNGKAKGVELDFLILSAKPLGLIPQTLGDVEDIPRGQGKPDVFCFEGASALCQIAKVMLRDGHFAAVSEMAARKPKDIKQETPAEICFIHTVSPGNDGEYYLISMSISY